MLKRILAIMLAAGYLATMLPVEAAQALESMESPAAADGLLADETVENAFVEAEIPMENEDSGAMGIAIDDGEGQSLLPEGAMEPSQDLEAPEMDIPDEGPQMLFIQLPEIYDAGAMADEDANMAVNTGQLAMSPGSIYTLKAVCEDGSECEVIWSVDDASVASVDENGQVTALACGETTICALAENGLTAKCQVVVARVAETVGFNCESFYLGKGETSYALQVILGDGGDDYFSGYTLVSSNPKYVRINDDGSLTGLKNGSATITVTTENNQTASIQVTVKNAPTKVKAAPGSMTLGIGESAVMGYTLSSGSYGRATFESANPDCAAVDVETGVITAVAPGTTKIKIKTYNGKQCTATVKVVNAPTFLQLSQTDITMGVGWVKTLKAVMDDGSAGKIEWESSDPSVLTVENGKLTAVGTGEAWVTARTYVDGASHQCRMTIKPAPEKVTLEKAKLTIGVGQKLQLEPDVGDSVGECTYSSSKKQYATVSADGVITGKKKGTTTITVKTYNGKKTSVKVSVVKAPSKVSARDVAMGLGEKRMMSYALSSGSCGSVTFASSHPDCVWIDPVTGEMEARGMGEAEIRITTHNKKSCTARVQVKAAPENIALDMENVTLRAGETAMLTAIYDSETATTIEWQSLNSEIATVSDGKILAVSPGETEIVARSHVPGVYARCLLTVTPAPEPLKVTNQKIYLGLGETVNLGACGGEPSGEYRYASSKKSCVSVDESGNIRGRKTGKATISVASADGQIVKVSVSVGKKPTKVTANPGKMQLGLGETGVMGYKLTKGCYGRVKYASRQPECVIIDENTGVMTAVGIGTATIDIVTYNGKKTTAKVQVVQAPTQVNVSMSEVVIGEGQSVKVSASMDAGAAGKLTWRSDDETIARVESGNITGLMAGNTRVYAETYVEGISGAVSVIVKPAPEKVTLPENTVYLGLGEETRLEPDVGDSVGGFTYASSNKKIVRVYSDGTIKAVKTGSAKITVKTYNGKKVTVTVKVYKAPGKITPALAWYEMGVGDVGNVGYSLPRNTTTTVTYSSSNESILKVDPVTGEMTAMAVGQARLCMRTHNGKEAYCTVAVYPAPKWVMVNQAQVEMAVGQQFKIQATLSEGSRSVLRYESADPGVAVVSEDGVIEGTGRGSTTIYVKTCAPDVYAAVEVVVWDAPQSVKLNVVALDINVDETYRIQPIIPEGSMTHWTFTSSNPALATVSEDGWVNTHMRGSVFITATAHNGKHASVRLNIQDPWYPEAVQILNAPEVLLAGSGNYCLEWTVQPETARPRLQWTSSNEKVATVSEDGVIAPMAFGYTTISAVSEKNADIQIQFVLAVETRDKVLTIPARTTDEEGIEENLKKIDAIRQSAIREVDALLAGGVIKSADASKRKAMINNIFKDYAFAWKTPSFQKYWRTTNSEGGVKHFQPDRVYYGLPYVSGSGTNRAYNVAKALKENRYTDSGLGYYLLNQKKLLNGQYVGNDCSGLVNTTIWGTSSSHTYDRTSEIASSKAYKTIKSFKSMRPGDLICLGNRHVVMFLYYADADKNKIMIIENGGSEPGTNTVHCAVHNVSYYTKQGYRVRRLATLG